MHDEPTVPYGYCHCGCGLKTTIAPQSHTAKGYVRGEPRRFYQGHGACKTPFAHEPYVVDPESGCWVWQRALSQSGYGCGRDSNQVHRKFYEDKHGPLEGVHLDHLCRNRACVNPDHLEPVTPAENVRRGDKTILSRAQVVEIKRLIGTLPNKDIAARYGVDPSHISHIKRGRVWGDV